MCKGFHDQPVHFKKLVELQGKPAKIINFLLDTAPLREISSYKNSKIPKLSTKCIVEGKPNSKDILN